MNGVSISIVMAVTCHYCSQARNPREVMRLSSGVVMCWHCAEWHDAALRMIAGEPPKGCQTCDLTFEELEAIYGDNVRMIAVPKDGIYQVQCGACADGYIPLRRDLIKGTKFAAAGGFN